MRQDHDVALVVMTVNVPNQPALFAHPHGIYYDGRQVGSGADWESAIREAGRLIREEMPWVSRIKWYRCDVLPVVDHWVSAAGGEWLGYSLIPAPCSCRA